EVAGGGAVLDPTGARDRPGRDEEGLNERRLAGPGVADEHDVADSSWLGGRGCFADGGPCGIRLVSHALPPGLIGRTRFDDSPPVRPTGASPPGGRASR